MTFSQKLSRATALTFAFWFGVVLNIASALNNTITLIYKLWNTHVFDGFSFGLAVFGITMAWVISATDRWLTANLLRLQTFNEQMRVEITIRETMLKHMNDGTIVNWNANGPVGPQ